MDNTDTRCESLCTETHSYLDYVLSYRALLVLMTVYAGFMVHQICKHMANMMIAQVDAPPTDKKPEKLLSKLE
jgi:hypothetical protein